MPHRDTGARSATTIIYTTLAVALCALLHQGIWAGAAHHTAARPAPPTPPRRAPPAPRHAGTTPATATPPPLSCEGLVHGMPDPPALPVPGYPQINLEKPSLWRVYTHRPPRSMLVVGGGGGQARQIPEPPYAAVCLEGVWRAVRNKSHALEKVVPEAEWQPRCAHAPKLPALLRAAEGEPHSGLDVAYQHHLQGCLAGKTLVIAGNSLARAWAFELHRFFRGGKARLRSDQKKQCAFSCGMFLKGPVHIAYIQSLNMWLPDAPAFSKTGAHSLKVASGAPFGIRPDVFIFGSGHQDVFAPGYSRERWEGDAGAMACYLKGLAASGVRVFYRTAVPFRKHYHVGFFGNHTNVALMNRKLREINAYARQAFAGSRVTLLDEEALADAAFAQHADDSVYEDHIHTPSIAAAMLQYTFASLCPK